MNERAGLVARVRRLRRAAAAEDARSAAAIAKPDSARVRVLEDRVTHLEQLLEGLQDSVYREAERHGKRIADLEAQIQPAALGAALDRDARARGL